MDKYTGITGIIGFGSIAKIHSRIMYENNNPINCVFTRSKSSIQKIKEFFKKEFSYVPEIVNDCNIFFSKKICSLVISSPPSTHYDYLLKAFDRKIPVFCEKPLFWEKNTSLKELEKKISIIESHKNKNFLVNTNNSYFVDEILKIKKVKKIKFLKFIFHTNGLNKFSDIGIDLLPHGLSILIRALGFDKISNLKKSISESFVKYKFIYKNADIEFEFMQGSEIEKKMIIQLNNFTFMRVQNGSGTNYKVGLIEGNGEKIKSLKDPFNVYMGFFLQGFRQHKEDLFNLQLMCEILKDKKR